MFLTALVFLREREHRRVAGGTDRTGALDGGALREPWSNVAQGTDDARVLLESVSMGVRLPWDFCARFSLICMPSRHLDEASARITIDQGDVTRLPLANVLCATALPSITIPNTISRQLRQRPACLLVARRSSAPCSPRCRRACASSSAPRKTCSSSAASGTGRHGGLVTNLLSPGDQVGGRERGSSASAGRRSARPTGHRAGGGGRVAPRPAGR